MKKKRMERKHAKARSPSWVRASISFPSDLYEALQEVAKQKKVSLAWIVRDAAENYLASAPKYGGGEPV